MVAVPADQGLPGATGQRAPGIGPDGRVVVVQTKLQLRHGDRLTYRRWDADFNNCASMGQLNGLLNNRAVPTVEAVQLSFKRNHGQMSSCRNSGSQPRHHCQGRCGRCFGFTKSHGVLSHWIESGSAGWPGRDACFRRAGAGAWLKRLAWVKPSTKLRDTMWA